MVRQSMTGDRSDTCSEPATQRPNHQLPSISRRRWMRAVGAGCALGVGAGTIGTAAARRHDGDYEEIVIEAGEQAEIMLEDGDRFENKLIDLTADGASLLVATSDGGRNDDGTLNGASNWAIRNVGIKGIPADPAESWSYLFWIGETDPDTTSVFENVFFDGREPTPEGEDPSDHGWRGGLANTDGNHRGHMVVRNNFVAGCGDNANYFESGEEGGTIEWRNCYHRDNTVTSFRTVLAGSQITDSVAVLNDPEGTRGSYPWISGGSQLSRVLWNRGANSVDMENVHVHLDPDDIQPTFPVRTSTSQGDDPVVNVRNCTINEEWVNDRGGDPEESMYFEGDSGEVHFENLEVDEHVIKVLDEGVPYTPEMAARGERSIPPNWKGRAPGGGVPGKGTNV